MPGQVHSVASLLDEGLLAWKQDDGYLDARRQSIRYHVKGAKSRHCWSNFSLGEILLHLNTSGHSLVKGIHNDGLLSRK